MSTSLDVLTHDEPVALELFEVTKHAPRFGPRRTRYLTHEFDSAADLVDAVREYPATKERFQRVSEHAGATTHVPLLITSLKTAVDRVDVDALGGEDQ
jgi:hypothetical protein